MTQARPMTLLGSTPAQLLPVGWIAGYFICSSVLVSLPMALWEPLNLSLESTFHTANSSAKLSTSRRTAFSRLAGPPASSTRQDYRRAGPSFPSFTCAPCLPQSLYWPDTLGHSQPAGALCCSEAGKPLRAGPQGSLAALTTATGQWEAPSPERTGPGLVSPVTTYGQSSQDCESVLGAGPTFRSFPPLIFPPPSNPSTSLISHFPPRPKTSTASLIRNLVLPGYCPILMRKGLCSRLHHCSKHSWSAQLLPFFPPTHKHTHIHRGRYVPPYLLESGRPRDLLGC